MARGCCNFRQRDVTAALRAARAAGLDVQRVIIDREGKIQVVVSEGEGELKSSETRSKTEWHLA